MCIPKDTNTFIFEMYLLHIILIDFWDHNEHEKEDNKDNIWFIQIMSVFGSPHAHSKITTYITPKFIMLQFKLISSHAALTGNQETFVFFSVF